MVVQSFLLILYICVYFICNVLASVHIEGTSSFNSL